MKHNTTLPRPPDCRLYNTGLNTRPTALLLSSNNQRGTLLKPRFHSLHVDSPTRGFPWSFMGTGRTFTCLSVKDVWQNQNRSWIVAPCFCTVVLGNLQVFRKKINEAVIWGEGGFILCQALHSWQTPAPSLPHHPLCVLRVWDLMFPWSAWKRARQHKQIPNQTVESFKRWLTLN